MALKLIDILNNRRKLRGGELPGVSFQKIDKRSAYPGGRQFAISAKFNVRAAPKGHKHPTKHSTQGLGTIQRFANFITGKQTEYDTAIIFEDVLFYEDEADVRDKAGYVTVNISKGWVQYMDRPSLTDTPCKVTCTCPDFYWTWWWYLEQQMSLAFGRPIHPSKVTGHAVRQTDGKPYGTVPGSRNDREAPGCCKHIVYMARIILNEGYILTKAK